MGLHGGNLQSQLILCDLSRVAFCRILQHEFQPGLMERSLHQEHRVAVAPQRRQPAGKHPQAGVGDVGREQRILRPENRHHGQGADAAASIGRGDCFLRHKQHPAGGVGDRRQALPVDLGADSQGGEADPFGAQDRQHTPELGGVGPSQTGPVADIDDGTGGRGSCEEFRRSVEHRDDVGRSQRRAMGEGGEGGLESGAGGRLEAVLQRQAVDVDCRHQEAVGAASCLQQTAQGLRGRCAKSPRLAGGGVDQHQHIGCRSRLRRCSRLQADRRDGGIGFAPLECLHEGNTHISRRGLNLQACREGGQRNNRGQ